MRIRITILVSVLFALGACSSEEGLLLRTTTSIEQPITTLRYYIGEEWLIVKDRPQDRYFRIEERALSIDLNGRNLSEEPFKLFVKQDEMGDLVSENQGHLMVGVMALNGTEVVGIGYEEITGFVDGKVLEWTIDIKAEGSLPFYRADAGCLKWLNEDSEVIHVGTKIDQDCDGDRIGFDCDDTDPFVLGDSDGDSFSACVVGDEMDCNDEDPDIYPGAPSLAICGEPSNDCNTPVVEETLCYELNVSDGKCRQGFQNCSEDFAECIFGEDPPIEDLVFCAIDCNIVYDVDGNLCEGSAVEVPRPALTLNACSVRLDGNAPKGWDMSAIPIVTQGEGPCDNVQLRVVAAANGEPEDGDARDMAIRYSDQGNDVLRVPLRITENQVSVCDPSIAGFSCNDAAWLSVPVPISND